MSNLEAIETIEEGYESQDRILEAYQTLIDSGAVWSLQGFYGRNAAALIDAGLCEARTA